MKRKRFGIRKYIVVLTVAMLITAIIRFSSEEKAANTSNDSERIKNYSIINTSLMYYTLDEEDVSETWESMNDVFDGDVLPVIGKVTSGFGYRNDPFGGGVSLHSGTDIGVDKGTEVHAVADGTVKSASYDESGGNYIVLEHKNGYESYYGHLSNTFVSEGEAVTAGDVIALSGATGKVTGAHLHFGIYCDGKAVDPELFFDFDNNSG